MYTLGAFEGELNMSKYQIIPPHVVRFVTPSMNSHHPFLVTHSLNSPPPLYHHHSISLPPSSPYTTPSSSRGGTSPSSLPLTPLPSLPQLTQITPPLLSPSPYPAQHSMPGCPSNHPPAALPSQGYLNYYFIF